MGISTKNNTFPKVGGFGTLMITKPSTIVSYDDPYYDEFAKQRLLSKIRRVKGCWVWIGSLDKNRYGVIRYRGETWRAHRLSFMIIGKNRLISGLVIDHFVCNNPSCINPDHMKQVTTKENNLRSESPWANNFNKDSCAPKGHSFTKDNIIWQKNGSRQCKKCYNKLHPKSKKYPLDEIILKKEVFPTC